MGVYKLSNSSVKTGRTIYGSMLAGNSSWVTPDTGAMFPLQVVTVGPAGASSVSFTNIPNTYSHLQIRASYLCSSSNNPYLRVGGSSIDTAGNYSWHHLYGDGSSALSNGNGSQSFVYFGYSTNSSNPNVTIIDILDYANSNKNKTMKILAGQDNNGSGEVALWSGSWQNSSTAIQKIEFIPGAGNFTANSQFALYAVKGA